MEASGEHIRKKARAPTATEVRQEEEVAVEGATEVVVQAMEPPRARISARLDTALLHCTACLHPLKPPVFECQAGHAVCCGCKGHHCQVCNRTATFSHSANRDFFVAGVTVPCTYEGFGCNSFVVYHEAADHQRLCPHAPCFCPEPGFAGSPAMLHGHFAASHSWPVHEVRYGKPHKLTVPLQRWHVLVGAGDQCLFLMSVGAVGLATAVSLVCVRGNAAAPARYRYKVWAEVPGNETLLAATVGHSDLSSGFVAAEQMMFLTVPPGLVQEVSGETLLLLNVRIDKLRSLLN